jgi:hypothetical protein
VQQNYKKRDKKAGLCAEIVYVGVIAKDCKALRQKPPSQKVF